jgi:hypothetical protein
MPEGEPAHGRDDFRDALVRKFGSWCGCSWAISEPHVSSTTLVEDSPLSAAKHRTFNVICVSDATRIVHHWQKTCPKALSIANIY